MPTYEFTAQGLQRVLPPALTRGPLARPVIRFTRGERFAALVNEAVRWTPRQKATA